MVGSVQEHVPTRIRPCIGRGYTDAHENEETVNDDGIKSRRALWRGAALVALDGRLRLWSGSACGWTGHRVGHCAWRGQLSGDLEWRHRQPAVTVGDAVITVKSLQDAFQPVSPAQKLSDEALGRSGAGESFYQAYVRVENRGQFPLRVDPEDFVCRIGNTHQHPGADSVGPPARSLIYGTSLDLVLDLQRGGRAEPTLIYSPPWYDGVISFSAEAQSQGAATTTAPSRAGAPATRSATRLASARPWP